MGKNHKKSQFCCLEKGVLKFLRTVMFKQSTLFLYHNRHTQIYRLVSGPLDVQLQQRNHDFLTEDDDCPPLHSPPPPPLPPPPHPGVNTGPQQTHSSLQTGLPPA